MEREAFEFHDSVLSAVTTEAGTVRVLLDPGYIHRSTGVPGRDAGTGWSAPIEILIGSGSLEECPGDLPADVWEGSLQLGEREIDNVVPIPFAETASCELRILLNRGEMLRVRGEQITARVLEPYEFIENVPAG